MRWVFALTCGVAAAGCGSSSDHGDGGGGSGGPCDHAITTASCWSIATAAALAPPMATGFAGATFDGHYAYFAPYIGITASSQYTTSGSVRRLDTTADFTAAASWSSFDTTTVQAGAQGYTGAAFDGRYVYFLPQLIGMPFNGGSTPANGVVARYDTMATFGEASAWVTFDTEANLTRAGGYRGGAFDGRYLYLTGYTGDVQRYDTTAPFTTPSSWTAVAAAIESGAPDLAPEGVIFDGRYAYFLPSVAFNNAPTTVIARLDTTAPDITAMTAWAKFDTSALGAHVTTFVGGAFDGRYLYLAPAAGAPAVRYDTTAEFAAAASWAAFDPSPIAGAAQIGFQGAAFDGHFIYFVPNQAQPAGGSLHASGDIVRYDLTGDFATAASWSAYDTASLDATAASYNGAVFDGRYVYFEPNGFEGAFARFDALEPAAEPTLPGFHGSFL